MEEQTFLDYNPQFNNMTPYTTPNNRYWEAFEGARNGNAIERWFDPGLAEQSQLQRENYMTDKANAFTEYMFNKANEYNSPEEQLERMKAAGINPLLAAGGIAGNGATAQGAQGAQGSAPMNTNSINPIELLEKGIGTFTTSISGINELGTLLGFGKKNKAEIALIKTEANKTAEEMKYTRRQRKQLEGIGEILIDNARKEGNQIEANIKVLEETIEKLKEETKNIAQDTTLKEAQTGETLQKERDLIYKNYENEFKKIFRDIFGIQLNESDMSMLVQACLNGHGKEIINFFTKTIKGAIQGVKEQIREAIPNIPSLPSRGTPTEINGTKGRTKNINEKEYRKQIEKQIRYEWEHKRSIHNYWNTKGGFEAYLKFKAKQIYDFNW